MRVMAIRSLSQRWQSLPIRHKCGLVVAIPVMCLLFEIVWQARVLAALDDAQRWTTHTQEVELTVANLRGLLLQIESNDRAFVLTGREEFLEPLKQEEGEVQAVSGRLIHLVEDNPPQQARARNLQELAQIKVQVARDVVAYSVAHPSGSTKLDPEYRLRLLASKERMHEFMQQAASFAAEEQRLLDDRMLRLHYQQTASERVLLISVLVGIAAGVIAIQLFSSAVADRLMALTRGSRRIAEGELMMKPAAGSDEISVLAEALYSASRKIHEQMEGLESLNHDLESFSYSVSHDLRSPLRHIHGFSKILRADFSAELPEEAQRFLFRIESGAERMGRLIDDLLNFSRIGRREIERQPVALFPLVEAVVTELSETATRKIEWRIQSLPMVQGDAAMIKQIFVNLMGNATKFTRTRERPVVEVGTRVLPQGATIYVRDNGVGFDMKFADKLFGVFQRLHRLEDFEGTGVGLATVARIVHKHGGAVWAESKPDQGATFYFTLAGQMPGVPEREIAIPNEVLYAETR